MPRAYITATSDPEINVVAIPSSEGSNDDPCITLGLFFDHCMVGVMTENAAEDHYDGANAIQRVTIHARGGCNGEVRMLARALRWLAEQCEANAECSAEEDDTEGFTAIRVSE